MIEWTREKIYADPTKTILSPNKALHGQPLPVPPKVNLTRVRSGLSLAYTPAYEAELLSETEWVRIEQTSPAMEAEIRKAMENGEKCPACKTDHRYALHHGNVTGLDVLLAVNCECKFWSRMVRELATIPTRFADARLDTLTYSPKSLLPRDAQEHILATVKASPEDSFFLIGEPETGKTHISIALYRAALEKSIREQYRRGDHQQHVWRISATVLLQEHIAWDTRDKNDDNCTVPSPTVTEAMITTAALKKYKPCLFIDEIDKIVPSDFKLSRLFEIVDAVYAQNGQVVATSNKALSQLRKKWGADEAEAIVRRIANGDRAHMIRFSAVVEKSDTSKQVNTEIKTSYPLATVAEKVENSDIEVEGAGASPLDYVSPTPVATTATSTSQAGSPPGRRRNPMENHAAQAQARQQRN